MWLLLVAVVCGRLAPLKPATFVAGWWLGVGLRLFSCEVAADLVADNSKGSVLIVAIFDDAGIVSREVIDSTTDVTMSWAEFACVKAALDYCFN